MAESEFSRDLGYLDKFFDKLQAHADTLPSGQGEWLAATIRDERMRWAEIRALLEGSGDPAAAPDSSGAQEASSHSEPSSPQLVESLPPPEETPLLTAEELFGGRAHPYTRALQAFESRMAAGAPAPPAAPQGSDGRQPPPQANAAPRASAGFTVGSLKARR